MQEPLCVKRFQKLSLLFLDEILIARFRPAIVLVLAAAMREGQPFGQASTGPCMAEQRFDRRLETFRSTARNLDLLLLGQ